MKPKGSSAFHPCVWYVNASEYLYVEGASDTAVSGGRVKAREYIQEKMCSVEDFKKRHMSLHQVTEETRGDGASVRLVCDCPYFWNSNTYCSHVVAVYHKKGRINVFDLLSSLRAVRKRGRPTTREKALERDMDADQLDQMDARPGYYKKTPIRHPVYLNGMIYNFRTKPNHEVVWKVIFLDAPGGPQRYEMEKDEVVAAMDRYKDWYRQSSLIPQDEDGEDSC